MSDRTREVTKLDFSGSTYKYVGKAPANSATSDAKWFIKRLTFNSGVLETVETTSNFAVWDDRSTESYS